DLRGEGVEVAVAQVVVADGDGEVAVSAPMGAERDVDVGGAGPEPRRRLRHALILPRRAANRPCPVAVACYAPAAGGGSPDGPRGGKWGKGGRQDDAHQLAAGGARLHGGADPALPVALAAAGVWGGAAVGRGVLLAQGRLHRGGRPRDQLGPPRG